MSDECNPAAMPNYSESLDIPYDYMLKGVNFVASQGVRNALLACY